MDVMHEHWEALVERANAGDVQAAREILEVFSSSVEEAVNLRRPDLAWSGPVPLPIASYLGDAFRQIRNGADPAKALNLVGRSRGRRKGKTVTHNLDALAAAFSLLTRNGLKPEEANRALQDRLGVDRATIYRARRKKEAFEYWKPTDDGAIKALVYDEALKETAAPFSKQLTAILKTHRTKPRQSRDKRKP